MNILLTGSTGFLGSRCIPVLRSQGHTVYSLNRRKSGAVGEVVGDLQDEDLRDKLKDLQLDLVIHLAAKVATTRDAKLLRAVNHEGTVNLVNAVKDHPLRMFLFTSTVVVGEANGAVLTEDTELDVQTAYGASKQESERFLLQACADSSFPAVILRPSHVYGAGGWFFGIIKDLRRGLFRIPGNGLNLWDVVHVDDVVSAILLLLKKGQPGEIYHVADDTPVTMKDFFMYVARLLGKKKVGHAPLWLARIIAGRDPILSAIRSARSSNARLKKLGWSPKYPEYRAGLEAVFAKLD